MRSSLRARARRLEPANPLTPEDESISQTDQLYAELDFVAPPIGLSEPRAVTTDVLARGAR